MHLMSQSIWDPWSMQLDTNIIFMERLCVQEMFLCPIRKYSNMRKFVGRTKTPLALLLEELISQISLLSHLSSTMRARTSAFILLRVDITQKLVASCQDLCQQAAPSCTRKVPKSPQCSSSRTVSSTRRRLRKFLLKKPDLIQAAVELEVSATI